MLLRLVDTNPASGGDECVDADADALGFYDNPVYANAWSVVLSGISECSGPVVVTGEPGIGKSLLMKRAFKCVGEGVHPVFATHPERAITDLRDGIEAALGPSGTEVKGTDTFEGQLSRCRERLLATRQDRPWIALFVDDADALVEPELSGLLALALPDHEHCVADGCERLLTLILAGLPKLEDRLAQPGFRVLVGDHLRICRLRPLRPGEVGAYIQKRCQVLGSWRHQHLSAEAAARIGTCSRGIPRLIDNLCDAVTLTATRRNQERITEALVDEAAQVCAVSLALGTVDRADARAEPDTRPLVTDWRGKAAPTPGAADETLDGGRTDSEGESPSRSMARAAVASSASSPTASTSTPLTIDNQNPEGESPVDRTESLNKVLKSLLTGSPDVEASALITEDGLMVASALPQDLDETRVAGMSATLLSLGTRAAAELRRGEVQEVIVRGEEGYAVMIAAGRGVLLLVVANEHAKLGLIFFDMRQAISAIKRIL